jgi:NADP-dependent 3-hydroxy acid dehydrogenase YdfG
VTRTAGSGPAEGADNEGDAAACPGVRPIAARWLEARWPEGVTMVAGARTEPVLITGCSSGIGHAAAASLHAAGLRVYATARRVDSLADLARRSIATLPLDVTDEKSMADAVATVEADAGAVGTLINNAGYGLYGPVEQVPMDEVRRQFETNFFGLVQLTQLVLPGMRQHRGGRILNVSSMGGRATLPGGAFYHASK